MSHIDKKLQPGEKVIYTTTFHWMFIAANILAVVGVLVVWMGVLLWLYVQNYIDGAVALGFLTGIATIDIIEGFRIWRAYKNAEFFVTEKMLITTHYFLYNWFSEKVYDLFLHDIKEIQVKQRALGRKLKYGKILIRLFEDKKRIYSRIERRGTLRWIKDPYEFQRQVRALI